MKMIKGTYYRRRHKYAPKEIIINTNIGSEAENVLTYYGDGHAYWLQEVDLIEKKYTEEIVECLQSFVNCKDSRNLGVLIEHAKLAIKQYRKYCK
jgi:hypothetical protein